MASIQETTAVSIRKGNTAENLAFTGTIAEVTADLGIDGTGTDINATLRLHNGIVQGGIPLARADLTNVTTSALAKNRNLYGDSNLAYADLSNIEELTDDDQKNTVRDYMHSYGLALNTQIDDLELRKANTSMDNINTEVLATGEGEPGKHDGKNLAYADGSNVNTKYFADSQYRVTGETGDDPLAYANLSNVDTTNLVGSVATRPAGMSGPVIANSDLTNVADDTIKNRIDSLTVDGQTYRVEYTNNKINQINGSSAVNYPTTGAVISYVEQELDKLDYMNPNLDNATSWNPLYAKEGTNFIYNSDIDNFTTTGSDFTTTITEDGRNLQAYAPTSKALTGTVNLKLAVYSLSSGDNKPDSYRLYPEFGTTQLTSQRITFINNSGSKATGNLTCTSTGITGVYHYSLGMTSEDIVGPDDSPLTSTGWNAANNNDINEVPCYANISNIIVNPVLTARIDTVSSGKITKFTFNPKLAENEITSPESITIGHPLSVVVTKDSQTGQKYATATIQSGNNATFSLETVMDSEIPTIGGAGLLKASLDNLPGMTATDIAENNNASWSINKVKAIPAVTSVTIPASEYERLATIGQVWDSLKKIDSKIVFRQWS